MNVNIKNRIPGIILGSILSINTAVAESKNDIYNILNPNNNSLKLEINNYNYKNKDNNDLSIKKVKSPFENDNESEVLGTKLNKVDDQFNYDVKKTIKTVGKYVENVLPKGIKGKANDENIKVYYQYRF